MVKILIYRYVKTAPIAKTTYPLALHIRYLYSIYLGVPPPTGVVCDVVIIKFVM